MSSTGLDSQILLTKEHGDGRKAMGLHNISIGGLDNQIMVEKKTVLWNHFRTAKKENGMIMCVMETLQVVMDQFMLCVK